ncbi:MAG TPA: glycosyltransferase family 39 protein [Pyrinomonadaceae bacterium]|nr:glycosyltransferase family 39 protein [Pyrinomonadaceae bacterium]
MDETLNGQSSVFESWSVGGAIWRALKALKRFALAHRAETACACLLLLMSVNLLTAISRKSITNDEVVHIPAGYYHLVAGDFQLNNEHPPLVKMWAALPLLFVQPEEPSPADEPIANSAEKTWGFDEEFWHANRARFLAISFWPRVIMVPVTIALGVFIFAFARTLFGARGAVFAVALFTLEPTMLAHGRIVHTDVPVALTYLVFFFALLNYFRARTLRRALILGLASGLALITKFSMIVLLPLLGCLMLAAFVFAPRLNESRKRVGLHATIVVCLALFTINAAYQFQSPPVAPADVQWVQARSPGAFDRWMTFFRVGSKVVPTYYLFGQYNVMLHNRDGHPTSLLGHYSTMGWRYYFPVAFALKTTLPFLLISIAALSWTLWMWLRKKDNRFLWLLVPLAIYAALSMTSHINIGVRHFLPVYPFLFIAGGALLERLLSVRRARYLAIALAVVTFGWMGVEVARAYPDYMPYMNQLASGHPHWWYLSDSNVEWGDDVGALADYLKARGETSVRGALSGGWSTLASYDVEFISLAPPNSNSRDTRYVAIGASYLNGSTVPSFQSDGVQLTEEQRVNYFDQYRRRTPEAIFGGSIFLYREHE